MGFDHHPQPVQSQTTRLSNVPWTFFLPRPTAADRMVFWVQNPCRKCSFLWGYGNIMGIIYIYIYDIYIYIIYISYIYISYIYIIYIYNLYNLYNLYNIYIYVIYNIYIYICKQQCSIGHLTSGHQTWQIQGNRGRNVVNPWEKPG